MRTYLEPKIVELESRFDVVIIGGGPAGASAAVWCSELGLSVVVLEREKEFGGQLLIIQNRIENLVGIESIRGVALRDRIVEELIQRNVNQYSASDVTSVDLEKMEVVVNAELVFSAGAIVVATGIRRRPLDITGISEFRGRGVLESGVASVGKMAGKTVVIVGGGDAAVENALILSEIARQVYVVHRRSQLTARQEFVKKAHSLSNVEFVSDSVVEEVLGSETVAAVSVNNTRSGQNRVIETDAVLVRIGIIPNSELFRGVLEMDENGYIMVDQYGRTNRAGIYAIGDVSSPMAPTISGAIGDGATAAKAIKNFLVR